MRVFCSLREHFRRASPAEKASGPLVGYGEQEHGEALERGHAPFVVYVKMYEKVVVHEVKVDIFGVAHADIKNRLRHPEKVGYDAYFHGFRVLACIFCDLDVSAFQKKNFWNSEPVRRSLIP